MYPSNVNQYESPMKTSSAIKFIYYELSTQYYDIQKYLNSNDFGDKCIQLIQHH